MEQPGYTTDFGPWTDPRAIDESLHYGFKEAYRQVVATVLEACAGSAAPQAPLIVEVGSGLGALGEIVPPHMAGNYIQTDRTPLFAAHSRDRNPQLKSAAADVYDLPFARGSANMVVARDLFDMVGAPEAAASEIYDVLQPESWFAHFHDRRPNVGHIVRQLRATDSGDLQEKMLLPGISEQGLTHLRLIDASDYNRAKRYHEPRLKRLLDEFAEDIENLDSKHRDRPDQLAEVAGWASTVRGQDTKSFVELFHLQTEASLRAAGFRYVEHGSVQSQALVASSQLNHLFSKQSVEDIERDPYEFRNNVLVQQPSGRFELYLHDDSVPDGLVRQVGTMSVLLAQK